MNRRLCLWTIALTASCLLISVSGCNLTLGPQTKTVYTLIQPGKPCEILEKSKVKVRVLTTGNEKNDPVVQDIGGWITMPMSHFEAMKKAIESKEENRP